MQSESEEIAMRLKASKVSNHLTLSSFRLSDVSFLRGSLSPTLVRLDLDFNEIVDLSPLEGFLSSSSSLNRLSLRNNCIVDLSPLRRLPNSLVILDLASNQIEDLSPLEGFVSSSSFLKVLRLGTNRIRDISPLRRLPTSLVELRLSRNQIEDISPLTQFLSSPPSSSEHIGLGCNLKLLHLENNRIVDLVPLRLPSTLDTLFLNSNLIEDISPLKTRLKASSLEMVDLDDNRIADFSPLKASLPCSLKIMNIDNNLLADPKSVALAIASNTLNPICQIFSGDVADAILHIYTNQIINVLVLICARQVRRFGARSALKRLPVELIRYMTENFLPMDPEAPDAE
jgi:Leucine-rich repeat (LRR) protein